MKDCHQETRSFLLFLKTQSSERDRWEVLEIDLVSKGQSGSDTSYVNEKEKRKENRTSLGMMEEKDYCR